MSTHQRVLAAVALCTALWLAHGYAPSQASVPVSAFPASGVLRAFSDADELTLIDSPLDGERKKRQVVVEDSELLPIPSGGSAMPLTRGLGEDGEVRLLVGDAPFAREFSVDRASEADMIVVGHEDFRVVLSNGSPFPSGRPKVFWTNAEAVADIEVTRAGVYALEMNIKASRVYESVPRVALVVDGEIIDEFDVAVSSPFHVGEYRVGDYTYLEPGKHTCAIRLVRTTPSPEKNVHMGVEVLETRLIPQDALIIPPNGTPSPTHMAAIYPARRSDDLRWWYFVDEELTANASGLYIAADGGIAISGDHRPSVFSPPGTTFEWRVNLPSHTALEIAAAVKPASWHNAPAHGRFRIELVPDGGQAETAVLLDEKVASWSDPAQGQWRDLSFDLDKWANQTVKLCFSTVAAEENSPCPPAMFWSEPRLYKQQEKELSKPENKPNVVILLIDTLRADHLSSYGYDWETSPAIDALGEEGVLFENAISQAPATLPSAASLLTGLYPKAHGVRVGGRIDPQAQTFAQVLAKQGYMTYTISDSAMVSPKGGFARGCDRFYALDYRYGAATPAQTPVRLVKRTVEECLAAAEDRPFFLYLHAMYPHDDYWAPPELRELFAEDYEGIVDGRINICHCYGETFFTEDFRHLKALYDAEVRHADHLVRDTLHALDAAGCMENSIVIVTSDHGEEFFEHGAWGHCHTLFRELLHVPLIMSGPGLPAGQRIEQAVQLTDVVPTLLDLLQLPSEQIYCGQSMLPAINGRAERGRTIFSEAGSALRPSISIQNDRYKYIRTTEIIAARIREGEFLFDLQADLFERNNILHAEPGVAAQMRAQARAFDEQYSNWFGARRKTGLADLTPEEIDRLEALGYLN